MRNLLVVSRYLILLVLLGLGVGQIVLGRIVFGAALIGGGIGALIALKSKERRVKTLEAQGLNPYDERYEHINGQAAVFTIYLFSTILALIVLLGSFLVREVPMVNVYDCLGICLAALLILYSVIYIVYSRRSL